MAIKFKNIDNFNFAYDLIDALADKEPDKLAMLHISDDMTERRFTFKDMKEMSSQAANYFKSLGIKFGNENGNGLITLSVVGVAVLSIVIKISLNNTSFQHALVLFFLFLSFFSYSSMVRSTFRGVSFVHLSVTSGI